MHPCLGIPLHSLHGCERERHGATRKARWFSPAQHRCSPTLHEGCGLHSNTCCGARLAHEHFRGQPHDLSRSRSDPLVGCSARVGQPVFSPFQIVKKRDISNGLAPSNGCFSFVSPASRPSRCLDASLDAQSDELSWTGRTRHSPGSWRHVTWLADFGWRSFTAMGTGSGGPNAFHVRGTAKPRFCHSFGPTGDTSDQWPKRVQTIGLGLLVAKSGRSPVCFESPFVQFDFHHCNEFPTQTCSWTLGVHDRTGKKAAATGTQDSLPSPRFAVCLTRTELRTSSLARRSGERVRHKSCRPTRLPRPR